MKRSHNVRSADHKATKTATPSAAQQSWHVLSLEAAKDTLQTDVARGLTQIEATRRLAQHEPNTLAQARERSAFSILFAQFRSLIVALLVAATVITFFMGENIEAIAILVVIVVNATICEPRCKRVAPGGQILNDTGRSESAGCAPQC